MLQYKLVDKSTSLKDFIKQKRDETQNTPETNVEFLYISQNTPPATGIKIKSNQIIKILCNENQSEFVIPYETAKKSGFISNILQKEESGIQYKETQENVVRLPQFKADVLEEVLRFCARDSLINPTEDEDSAQDTYTETHKPRVAFLVTLDPSIVIDVVIAAHFLAIPPLVGVAIRYIAEYIDVDDVSALSTVPPDVLHQIYINFTPQQLAHIEMTETHRALDFDTSRVWQLLCAKQGWIITDTTENSDWKCIYFEQLLRCALISWNEKSRIEDLVELISGGAHFIRKLFVNRTEPAWDAYIHLLPHLAQLDIWDVPINKSQCQHLADVLSKCAELETLALCECTIDDENLEILTPLLTSPGSRVSKLDLSLNSISQQGTEKLAERLKNERSKDAPFLTITLSFNNVEPGPKTESGTLQNIDFGGNAKCIVVFDRTFLQKNHPHRY